MSVRFPTYPIKSSCSMSALRRVARRSNQRATSCVSADAFIGCMNVAATGTPLVFGSDNLSRSTPDSGRKSCGPDSCSRRAWFRTALPTPIAVENPHAHKKAEQHNCDGDRFINEVIKFDFDCSL